VVVATVSKDHKAVYFFGAIFLQMKIRMEKERKMPDIGTCQMVNSCCLQFHDFDGFGSTQAVHLDCKVQ
jgi:hypothetical protein